MSTDIRTKLLAARAEIDRLLEALPEEQAPQSKPEPIEFMTPREFAAHLRVSLRTVQAWVAGGLPVLRFKRRMRVKVAVAEEWLRLKGRAA